MTVGKRLRLLRTERGLTQTDVANLLGMTKGAIQKYEAGQIRNFKADTIQVLAEFFDVSPLYFIYDEIPFHNGDVHSLLSAYFGGWYIDFMMNFTTLTEAGQKKVIEYCEDLTYSTKYRVRGEEQADKLRRQKLDAKRKQLVLDMLKDEIEQRKKGLESIRKYNPEHVDGIVEGMENVYGIIETSLLAKEHDDQ